MPKPAWHHDKRSRQERGYGASWDRIRPVILARDGYRCRCEDCTRKGLLKPATHVDHVLSKANWLRKHGTLDGVDDPSNLRAINAQCHPRKSVEEKGHVPRSVIGADGYPVD